MSAQAEVQPQQFLVDLTAQPERGAAPLNASLSAQFSLPWGQQVAAYQWTVDGQQVPGSHQYLVYQFLSPGSYQVGVTVQTDAGWQQTGTTTVTVDTDPASASVGDRPPRPVMPFAAEVLYDTNSLVSLAKAGLDEIGPIDASGAGLWFGALRDTTAWSALRSALALSEMASPPERAQQYRGYAAGWVRSASQWLLARQATVLSGISTQGRKDPGILLARDAAYVLALDYHLNGKVDSGRMAASILKRLADVIPSWPIVDRDGTRYSQNDDTYLTHWDAAGLWSDWYYLDLQETMPLPQAYDLIADTEVLPAAEADDVRSRLFGFIVRNVLRFQPSYGNMDGYPISDLFKYVR